MKSGMIKTKWSDIVLLKQRFQSHRNDPFAFRPKFWLLLSKVGLKTKIFGNGKGSFGRTGPTVQEDHLWRWTILTGNYTQTKASHLFLDRNFRKFCYNGKHPILFLMLERRSLSGGAFLHTVGYYKECPLPFHLRYKKRVTSNIIYYWARAWKEWETSGCSDMDGIGEWRNIKRI